MEEIVNYIEDLLINLGYDNLANYASLIIALIVIIFGSLIPFLWQSFQQLRKYFQQRKLNKDLHPFFTPVEIKKATQYYIPTKCQNIAPSKENEPGQTHAFATREKIIPFFINQAFK